MFVRSRWTVAAVFGLLLAGCSSENVSAPTGRFAQAVDSSAGAIEADFSGEFAHWQESYIAFHAIKGIPIDEAVLEGRAKPADEPTVSFSPEAIRARIAVIEAIRAYAAALCQLADTHAPDALASGGEKAGTELGSLTAAAGGDPSISAYAQPIVGIAGWLGADYAGRRRDAAIADAVHSAAPAFRAVTDQLKIDLTLLQQDQQGIAAKLLSLRVRRFNAAARPGNDAALEVAGREVLDAEAARRALAQSAALDTIDAWRSAHDRLVAYLASPQTQDDLASFQAATEAFAARVGTLSAQITAIEKAK